MLYERVLEIQRREYGEEHPDTARCLHGLARVLMKQDEEARAGPSLGRALAIKERAIGSAPVRYGLVGAFHIKPDAIILEQIPCVFRIVN